MKGVCFQVRPQRHWQHWKSQRAQKLDLINVRRMKLWNEIGHPVCTVEMWWLRTTLAIFRGAVWAETCCCAPKVRCFQSRVRSASSPSLSKKPVLRLFRCHLLQLQVAVAADAGLPALISRVVYSIDLSLPQVVTLGKNSRGYHYILANLVSSNQAAPRKGAGPVLFCMCINANLHALYLSYSLLCLKRNPPHFCLLSFLSCLFINHHVADRPNCVFHGKWMSHAINKEHSTFHIELCGAAISLSLPEEGNIHLALRI